MATAISDIDDAGFNSYASLAEADTYFAEARVTTGWSSLTEAVRNNLLIWATSIIDTYSFAGHKVGYDQNLQWPRHNVRHKSTQELLKYSEIPVFLKTATYELAFKLSSEDITQDNETRDLDEVVLGELELKFSKQGKKAKFVPDYVKHLISPFTRKINRLVRS